MWSALVNPSRRRCPTHWSAGELASAIGVSRVTIGNWARRGLIPYVRVGRDYRFPPDVLAQAMSLGGRVLMRRR